MQSIKTDDEIKKARKVTQLILTHFYKPVTWVSTNYIYSKKIFSVSLFPQYHANKKEKRKKEVTFYNQQNFTEQLLN